MVLDGGLSELPAVRCPPATDASVEVVDPTLIVNNERMTRQPGQQVGGIDGDPRSTVWLRKDLGLVEK